MRNSKEARADVGLAIVLLALAVFFFWSTFDDIYDEQFIFNDVSTVFFPRIELVMLMGLTLLLLIRAVRYLRVNPDKQPDIDDPKWDPEEFLPDPKLWGPISVVFIMSIVYAALLNLIGFIPASIIYSIVLAYYMGHRNILTLLMIVVPTVFASWYIMVEVAQLSLPVASIEFLRIRG